VLHHPLFRDCADKFRNDDSVLINDESFPERRKHPKSMLILPVKSMHWGMVWPNFRINSRAGDSRSWMFAPITTTPRSR